ncbi:MAG: DUF423 domain-containing protein [Cyclobacteriaceae bacterium]|nr:DUF423 domain-containing protein [Cyclobacteriaceae bacterium]
MKRKSVLLSASVLGLLGVALGAFGAHALKPMLTASGRLETFELAVRYQFYHALALLGCGLLMHHNESRWLRYASISWVAGVFLFSGSLYLLCFTGLSGIAMITPFGGVMMIAGWAMLFVGALNSEK